MDRKGPKKFDDPGKWAVQTGAEKILAAEDMHNYAIFSLDADGNVVTWNAGAERMKGYRSEEVIGRHFSVFYPPEQVASGYPQWELEQAATNGFYIDRGWRVRKDGSRFWAHVVITVQRAPDGGLRGFIKVTRNESEVEARQQRSKRRFSDLFELASTGIALFDDSGRFRDANGALCDLLGYRLHELREMSDHDVLHPEDGNGGLLPGSRTGFGGDAPPIPHRVLARADGEPVLCTLHSAASVQDDGSRSWLVIFHDVTEQIRHTEALRYQTTHDELTGLLNRRGFEAELAPLLSRATNGQVAVLFCDLRNFKRVNDALGHEAGDELLGEVAQRLTTELPPKCTPARFYGDEFVILCSDLAATGGISALTDEVTRLFQMTVPLHQRRVHISASVGATVIENPRLTVAELLRSAEAAMFQARVRGQHQVNVTRGTVGSGHADSDQLAMEDHLRQAIARDQLGLHYQPVLDNTGAVILAEALLRWSPPEFGPLTPDVVLRVAEQGGILADLDRCVLRNALHEAAGWRTPDGRPVSVAVNLAGLRPEQQDFVDVISSTISEAGATPEHVVLEMVETVLAEMGHQPRRAMNELVSTGVQFAVDDFGTGYSSLARLKELPTQIVKLDSKFVSGVGTDPDDLGIVRAMTELARTLRRFCIAEGVENTTQHYLLRAVGVDAYQGYLFSPPLPAAEFRDFLRTTPLQKGP